MLTAVSRDFENAAKSNSQAFLNKSIVKINVGSLLGCNKTILFQLLKFSVFPAPAGINRRTSFLPKLYGRVPRASGDKPKGLYLLYMVLMCFPRQRG